MTPRCSRHRIAFSVLMPMFELVNLAAKGILRRSSKSLPVIMIIATATLSAHLLIGFIQGSLYGLQFGIVYGGTGHIQIGQPEQFKGYTDGGIDHTISPEQQARINAMFAGASVQKFAELNTGGLASNGRKTVPFSGLGIDVGADTRLRRTVAPVIEGKSLRNSRAEEFRATIGQTLAEQLSLQVGDAVTLLATTKQNAINAIDLTVVGIVSTGNRFSDAVFVEMPLENMQFLLDTEDVSRIVIYDESMEDVSAVASKLNERLEPPFVVRTWREVEPIFDQIRRSNLAQFSVLSGILSLVIFISLLSAISASILERRAQLGVLRALGMKKKAIAGIFLFEGTILSVVGCAIGLAISFGLVSYLDSADIMLPPPPGQNAEVPLLIFWDSVFAAGIAATVAAISALAALLTVRALAKRKITELVEG